MDQCPSLQDDTSSSQKLPFIEHQTVPFGTWEGLFDYFFESKQFAQWTKRKCPWQLRCLGEPGSGKTTLSTLTIKQLRKLFQDGRTAFASIFFVRQDQGDRGLLLASFLRSVLQQLTLGSLLPGQDCPQCGTCRDTQHTDANVEALRYAIEGQVNRLSRAFLIVDDIDLCSRAYRAAVEDELSALQKLGVSVMTTSRVPDPFQCELEVWCCVETEEEWHTTTALTESLYWCCKSCNSSGDVDEGFVICQLCMDNKKKCDTCGSSENLFEPYPHVEMHTNISNTSTMARFVARELELAHGNLGLDSLIDNLPPHSTLGSALVKGDKSLTAVKVQEDIVKSSWGNIAMAKLRLDNISLAQSIASVAPENVGDRLADNTVAMFDAGIQRMQQQEPELRDLGLKAIVAVATAFHEQPFEKLQQWLGKEAALASNSTTVPCFGLEEILHATQGFLIVDFSEDALVSTYHWAFRMYVEEDYNETLFWKRSEIRPGNMSRSSSFTNVTMKIANLTRQDHRPLKKATSRSETSKSSRPETLKELKSWSTGMLKKRALPRDDGEWRKFRLMRSPTISG